MKSEFKYAFLTGFHIRGPVFIVVFIMDTVFLTLGSLGLLPFAAQVTAVSLGGVGIAAMFAANILGDVAIARRMFSAPESFLYALTPVPRRKILLASVITMAVMDIVAMVFVISMQVGLSFNLAGKGTWLAVQNAINTNSPYIGYAVWLFFMIIAGYLLALMIIFFCVTARKSFLYQKPAGGFLAVLLGFGCLYAANILMLVLAPFSEVSRYGFLITLSIINGAAFPVMLLLILLEAAVLFIFTSKLMERKINL
ncbi:MAG: hypothetical protein FWF22_04860 [Treponema sp.]|nr:hypothetical protein [Treponema sp.]